MDAAATGSLPKRATGANVDRFCSRYQQCYNATIPGAIVAIPAMQISGGVLSMSDTKVTKMRLER